MIIKDIDHRLNNLRQAQVFAEDIEKEGRKVPEDITKEVIKARPQIEALERVKRILHEPVTEQDIVNELETMKTRLQEGKTKNLIERILDQLKEEMAEEF